MTKENEPRSFLSPSGDTAEHCRRVLLQLQHDGVPEVEVLGREHVHLVDELHLRLSPLATSPPSGWLLVSPKKS